MKQEKTALNEKINSLENEILRLIAKEKKSRPSTNKRENFIDFYTLIDNNTELKTVNTQLTNQCEDMKKENEIILEDYRRNQMNFDQLQVKYNEALEEIAQLKSTIFAMRNQGKLDLRIAAEKPKVFFDDNELSKDKDPGWSSNHFNVKKTEFPSEFIRSKFVSVNVNESEVKRNNDLRLSNYKEENNSKSYIKNSYIVEKEGKNLKTSSMKERNNNKGGYYEDDNIVQTMKKETNPELLFPFKKQFEYYENKNEKILKGRLVELKKEFFKEFEYSSCNL